MFAGHFGLAAAVKAKRPELPLWALMVSTQLLDILFVPLFVAGIESIDQSSGTGYGEAVIHADYTHSLAGTFAIAVLAGLLAWRAWGRLGGVTIAGVVFSHWLLDLIVHRMDMPFLPDNLGHFVLLGFGVWEIKPLSVLLELAIITVGLFMYVRYLRKNSSIPGSWAAIAAGAGMGVLLILSLASDLFGVG